MNIEKIVAQEMDQNCYLVTNGEKGILIDPGLDTFKILRQMGSYDVRFILFTHCHYDHIASAIQMDLPIVSSRKCSENMQNPIMTLNSRLFLRKRSDIIVEDGQDIELCGIKIHCIATPGHTDGGMCYLTDKCLFSGDTLFYESIGRSDFPSGDYDVLVDSIKNKLYTLPETTVVYPGHGNNTTIGFEKLNNEFVRG